MGNSKSKKTSHSCTDHCFAADINKTRNILSDTLNKNDIELPEYIVDIIMEYLPPIKIIEMESLTDKDYKSFNYPQINELLNKCEPPCPIWIDQFKSKQYKGKKIEKINFEDYIPQLKITVFGDVYKSYLVKRFVTGEYYDCIYDNCIEDSYRKMIEINGQQLLLDILDSLRYYEDIEESNPWMKKLICETHIFILCFRDDASFNKLIQYRDTILKI
eukprot:31266_1